MKRKLVFWIGLLIVVSTITAACQPSPQPETPPAASEDAAPAPEQPLATDEPLPGAITVSDDLGFEIALSGPAQSIISISPSLTEILFAVGGGEALIGRDSNSTYPDQALLAPDLGGMWDGIPVEQILALEPDLILAGEIFSAEAIAELRDLGLTVYWQANPDDFEQLFQNILDISRLTGTQDQAQALVESLGGRVEDIQGKLLEADGQPLVFYELDASDPANPWTAGTGTFISYVIAQAGGRNLGDSLEGEWVQISSEELVAQDPDFILLADALYGITPESLAERAGWSDLGAVQTGQVFPFDPFLLSVPGPRMVDGFQQVAEILHPEAFK